MNIYIPHRTAIVLCAEENLHKYGVTVKGRGYAAHQASIEAQKLA